MTKLTKAELDKAYEIAVQVFALCSGLSDTQVGMVRELSYMMGRVEEDN